MTRIAVITARGGSKRIPKKNIKDFCGKPIIAYSIEAAIKSGCFDEVMVSTDSEEIANIAREYGANVPFMRSEATSNDFATTADVLNEVVNEYNKLGRSFDTLVCLYPTAPFVTAAKLASAIENFDKAGADTLIPVVPFSYPPQRAYGVREGKLEFLQPEYINSRSQDLEKHYHDAGQFYLINVENFIKTGKLIGGNMVPLIVDELEVQDIDTETDWKLAEIKYEMMKK